jgi:hypothetical protein
MGPTPSVGFYRAYAYCTGDQTLSRHSPTRIVCLQTVTTVRVPYRIHQFFQNNTTNNNTILKYTTALAFYDSRQTFGYIIAILGCLESLSSLRVMYFNIVVLGSASRQAYTSQYN